MQELLEELRGGRGACLVLEQRPPAAVDLPDADGIQLVRHRASADEQALGYAGLAELAAPFVDLIDQLPPVQAAALAGALALGPTTGDSLAVAVGFRSLLHVAAERTPVLLVVEDAHLLDRGSAGALAYATRRIAGSPVGIVITQDPHHLGRLDLHSARRPSTPAEVSTAAEALEPADADRAMGLVEAGRAHLDAGQVDRALACATEAWAEAGDHQRAEVDLLLGRIHAVLGNGRTSIDHLRAAADAVDPARAATALLLMVPSALFTSRAASARDAVQEAAARLKRSDLPTEHPVRVMLEAARVAVALAEGEVVDPAQTIAVAVRAGEASEDVEDIALVATTIALPLTWLERYQEAGALLRRLISGLRERGALGALPIPLCTLSIVERRSGRPSRALVLAAEARDLADQTGHRSAWLFAQAELANVHSLFGDVERCRAAARAVLGPGGPGSSAYRTSALSALATVELWAGDPTAVIDLLEPLTQGEDQLTQAVTLYHHSLIAAYVAVGRDDDARALLAELKTAVPMAGGRLDAAAARCEALLAPPDQRDDAFAAAEARAQGQPLAQGLTRLLLARRLVADGETARGAAILRELAAIEDENLLGVARAARLTLTRLGLVASSGDPAWARLGPTELEVALASVEETPVLTLADRLRLSPPEVERIRDELVAVVGARAGPEVAEGMRRPPVQSPTVPDLEIRLLGGLAVRRRGEAVELPAGAASVAVALLAVRRAVHVEELADALWPDADVDVARRRLRNVLSRVRQSVGPILVRHGDRVELAESVVVDHHVLEQRARRALAEPPGPDRAAQLAAVLEADGGPLLPEAAYEEWSQPARRRAEVRRDEVTAALADETARGN